MRRGDTELASNSPGATAGGGTPARIPNARRVAAGKRNWALRKGLTEEGRQRLREAARRNQPWKHSTGPRTPEGKARSAQNARKRQLGPRSVRQLKRDLADLRGLLADMRANRQMVDAAYSEGR